MKRGKREFENVVCFPLPDVGRRYVPLHSHSLSFPFPTLVRFVRPFAGGITGNFIALRIMVEGAKLMLPLGEEEEEGEEEGGVTGPLT